MKRLISSTLLFGALAMAPVCMIAQDHPVAQKVYYDKTHKDSHTWNDNETTAWTQYRTDHHVKQAEFARATHKQQQDYWNWRHDHPDAH